MTVVLPARATVTGAVARLLIIEARNPGRTKTYKADKSKQSMQWMVVVLNNRLNNNPGQFMAPGATTLIDIIKAPGQFAGFGNYPNYDPDIIDTIQAILDIANAKKDSRAPAYQEFVQNALDVAAAAPIADPSIAAHPGSIGLAAWRTENSGTPGGNYSLSDTVAGNDFYYLNPPKAPKPRQR